MKRNVLIVWLGLITAMAAGCVTNPATGKKSFNIISEKQEVSLGLQAQPGFISGNGGEIPSPEIRKYVSDLGQRLAAASERPRLPWEYHVVDSSVINAFALPGGKVFITRGLLAKLTSEAQLAGVLGHETGHVNAMHMGQQMSQSLVLQGLVTGLGTLGEVSDNDYLRVLGKGSQAGGTLYLLKFSRDQESQADELGVRYMARLGYNPTAHVQVMEILKRAGGSGGLEMLQTHPLPQTRIDRLNAILKKSYPDAGSSGKYSNNEEAYKANVLARLAQLPPPKHTDSPAPADAGKGLRGGK